MATIIVTGVDGFVGAHLAAAASSAGHRVVGVTREPPLPEVIAPFVDEHYVADLRVEWPRGISGDVIIHLAGLAAVGPSFAEPQRYISGNSAMVTTMCEQVLGLPRRDRPRILGVSSGAVYAAPAPGARVTEDSPIAFSSPYVVSKVLVENQLAYYRARGLDTLVVRPFNHIGPGQSPGFLVPDLYESLQSADASRPLVVGNLATRRDYTDVRDVVRAYLLLATSPDHSSDVYNIASGAATSGWEILALLTSELGRPTPSVRVHPDRVRADDPDIIVGTADRLEAEFGWVPRWSVAESVGDFVRAVSGDGSPVGSGDGGTGRHGS